jgi:hypothetical protein
VVGCRPPAVSNPWRVRGIVRTPHEVSVQGSRKAADRGAYPLSAPYLP